MPVFGEVAGVKTKSKGEKPFMKTRAYILIETSVGTTSAVAENLREVKEATAVDMVTGPFDIIAVVEADNLTDIGGIVTGKMHKVTGVVKTITSLAITSD